MLGNQNENSKCPAHQMLVVVCAGLPKYEF